MNMRSQNKGWRLDYFVVSESLMPMIGKSFIRPEVQGSDHCPIGLLVARTKEQDMTETLAASGDVDSNSSVEETKKEKKRDTKKRKTSDDDLPEEEEEED